MMPSWVVLGSRRLARRLPLIKGMNGKDPFPAFRPGSTDD